MIHVCDVCRLVDNDLTEKECTFCEACNAWICTADETAWVRRAIAMKIHWLAGQKECEQCQSKLRKFLQRMGREDLIARL